jgi:hypothetical protein
MTATPLTPPLTGQQWEDVQHEFVVDGIGMPFAQSWG